MIPPLCRGDFLFFLVVPHRTNKHFVLRTCCRISFISPYYLSILKSQSNLRFQILQRKFESILPACRSYYLTHRRETCYIHLHIPALWPIYGWVFLQLRKDGRSLQIKKYISLRNHTCRRYIQTYRMGKIYW